MTTFLTVEGNRGEIGRNDVDSNLDLGVVIGILEPIPGLDGGSKAAPGESG
jgi:hypothetical protein